MLDPAEGTTRSGGERTPPMICEHCGRAGEWTEDGGCSEGSPTVSRRYRCLCCGHRQWVA